MRARDRLVAAGLAVALLAWVGVVRVVSTSTVIWPAILPVKVEATFGSTVVDLFPYLLKQELRITFGAQNENAAVQAGTIAFEIDNPDSHFTPDHPMSQYWPYVQLGVPIQVSVFWLGAWHIRFSGEASVWDPDWPYGDLSDEAKGRKGEARVSIVASGILRRLAQGKSPERSAEYRAMAGIAEGVGLVTYTPHVYIPMEDGASAEQFASGIAGGTAVAPTGPVTFASDGPSGSAPLARLGAGFRMSVPIPPYVDAGRWAILLTVSIPAEPAATTTLLEVPVSGGTAARWKLEIVPGATAEIWWRAYDSAGSLIPLLGQRITLGGPFQPTEADFFGDDKWWMLQVSSNQSGGNVEARIGYHDGADQNQVMSLGTVGTHGALAGDVLITVDSNLDGIGLGHLGVYTDAAYDVSFGGVLNVGPSLIGWAKEWVQTRLARLAREFDIPLTIIGSSTKEMGPQQIDTIYGLFMACAAVDVGILYEDREALPLALVYRTNDSLYNQSPALTLNARRNELTGPFRPAFDDLNVRNDVTVQRLGGSEYRSVVETGPKSVQPPPNGAGTYDEKLIINLFADQQARYNALWRTWRGTWLGMRYPRISPAINAAPDIAETWLATDIGDLMRVTDLPPQHPRTAVEALLRGYVETLRPTSWDVVTNASPAGPYRIGRAGNVTTPGAWLQTGEGTKLSRALGIGASPALVWSDGALFTTDATELVYSPLSVVFGGEICPVIPALSYEDFFTRTESNGLGGRWTTSGGTAANFSADGSRGVITIPTGDLAVRSVLLPDTYGDFDERVTLRSSQVATGATMVIDILARAQDPLNDLYRVSLGFTASGTVDASLNRVVGGAGTSLGFVGGAVAYSAGSDVHVHVQGRGPLLRVKVWLGDQGLPPDLWTISATDTTYATGKLGARARLVAGNTNVNPQFTLDNWRSASPAIGSALRHNFSTNAVNGWSPADTGQAVTTSGGAAGDYSVSGGRGLMSLGSVGTDRSALIALGAADVERTGVVYNVSAVVPTGANFEYVVRLRYVDANNSVALYMFPTTTNTVTCLLQQQIAGVGTNSAFILVAGATATSALRWRFQAFGTALRGRVWVDGQPEPVLWTVELTTSWLTAGDVVLRGLLEGGNTNALPVVIGWDEDEIPNPQTLSVTRTLPKVHAAGAPFAVDGALVACL